MCAGWRYRWDRKWVRMAVSEWVELWNVIQTRPWPSEIHRETRRRTVLNERTVLITIAYTQIGNGSVNCGIYRWTDNNRIDEYWIWRVVVFCCCSSSSPDFGAAYPRYSREILWNSLQNWAFLQIFLCLFQFRHLFTVFFWNFAVFWPSKKKLTRRGVQSWCYSVP